MQLTCPGLLAFPVILVQSVAKISIIYNKMSAYLSRRPISLIYYRNKLL